MFCGKTAPGLVPESDASKYGGVNIEDEEELQNDARLFLAYALLKGKIDKRIAEEEKKLDSGQKVLFRAMLTDLCFGQTKYDATQNYPIYYWCRKHTEKQERPKPSKVKKVLEKKLPGKKFEHENFMFMYRRGLKMRKKVVKAFEKFEKNFPIVKKIYDGARKKGHKRYKQLREKFPDMYSKLDPITERFVAGKKPPEECGTMLEKMQNKAAKKLEIAPTLQDVHNFRANHPLGRQITEALAYCYSNKKETSWESLAFEMKLLERAKSWHKVESIGAISDLSERVDRVIHTVYPPQITKREHVAFQRQKIFEKLKDKDGAKVPDFLNTVAVPDITRKFVLQNRPKVKFEPDPQVKRRRIGKPYSKKGHYKDKFAPAPVIQKIQDVPVGKQLTFPSKTKVERWEVCVKEKTLDRIDYVYWDGLGNKQIVYETKCLKSKMKEKEHEIGEDPVVISKREAGLLEKGMQVYVLDGAKPEDSIVVDAWNPDKDAPKDAVFLRGVYVGY